MFKLISLSAFLFFLSSCNGVYVAELKSTDTRYAADSSFVFENDTLKVTYDFSPAEYTINITLFNKLKLPLYLLWNKSGYIENDIFKPYYADQIISSTNGKEKYGYDIWGNPVAKTASTTLATKAEPVTLMPPMTAYVKVKRGLCSCKTLRLYSAMDSSSSFLRVRNYISYGISEKLEDLRVIDNNFYVSFVRNVTPGKSMTLYSPNHFIFLPHKE